MTDTEHWSYWMALDWLVEKSGWRRAEVAADGESAGWFVAQRAKTDAEKEEAHRMGRTISKGIPQ